MVVKLSFNTVGFFYSNAMTTFNMRTPEMVAMGAMVLAISMIHRGDCLTGFHFEDNLSKERSTPENGNLTFTIPKSDYYG